MRVTIGNATAIEGYRDGESDALQYKDAPGERVTTLDIPEGVSVEEAVVTVIATMRRHMRADTKPAWVEADDDTVRAYLIAHYDIEDKPRPPTWGSPKLEPQKKGS